MLLRKEGDAVVCIGQASHAWISGQLARAWADPVPEAVCLAAEQHDVGWNELDLAPLLDAESGLPVDFMGLPFDRRIELWRAAPHKLASQSLYAALLVSLHGTRLLDGDERAAEYLCEQADLQRRWSAELDADPGDLARHRDLIAEWDRLSLGLCLDWDDIAFEPWPFAPDRLVVACEGRRLEGRYTDEAELREALRQAPLVKLEFSLAAA